jgi:hypothetical protein
MPMLLMPEPLNSSASWPKSVPQLVVLAGVPPGPLALPRL